MRPQGHMFIPHQTESLPNHKEIVPTAILWPKHYACL